MPHLIKSELAFGITEDWYMRNLHPYHPSPRRKPGPPKLVKREQRRPVDSIQGVPAFAGMTGVGVREIIPESRFSESAHLFLRVA